MAMPYPPILGTPIAAVGDKNAIPDTNDPTLGLASVTLGFPPITSTPIAQGGVAPVREDFNGLFYLLSQFAFYYQSGGPLVWNEKLDYVKHAQVIKDDKQYHALQPSGPGYEAGAKDPATQADYWEEVYFGDVTVDGPGQGLHWAIAPTGTGYSQENPPTSGTIPGDWYTNHQDANNKIIVGQPVQVPAGGTWLVSWAEVKSSMAENGVDWDDSLGLTFRRVVFQRPYPGGTVFTPQDPTCRIILDAWRVL